MSYYLLLCTYIRTYLSVHQLPRARASLEIGADIKKYDYAVVVTYNQRSEAKLPDTPLPATPSSATPSSSTPIVRCGCRQRRLLTAAPSSTAPSSAKPSSPALLIPTPSLATLIRDDPHPQSPSLATSSISVRESTAGNTRQHRRVKQVDYIQKQIQT